MCFLVSFVCRGSFVTVLFILAVISTVLFILAVISDDEGQDNEAHPKVVAEKSPSGDNSSDTDDTESQEKTKKDRRKRKSKHSVFFITITLISIVRLRTSQNFSVYKHIPASRS